MFHYSLYTPFFITSTEFTEYFASNIIIWITKENFKPMAVCYTNFDAVQDCYVIFEQSFISEILIDVLVHVISSKGVSL